MFNKFRVHEPVSKRRMLSCNRCNHSAIHRVQASFQGTWDDPDSMISGGQEFSLYRCGGCDSVIFVVDSWDSEDLYHHDDGSDEAIVSTKQYPPVTSSLSSIDTSDCSEGLQGIVSEAASSLDNNNLLAATILARMTVEEICRSLGIAGKNLEKKIDSLGASVPIDSDQVSLLHEIRMRGNKGAHEATAMSADEIKAGFEIMSLIIDTQFSAPARAKRAVKSANRKLAPSKNTASKV